MDLNVKHIQLTLQAHNGKRAIFEIVRSGIVEENTDVIVNPCKSSMRHNGGLGERLLKAGGETI